jgi:glycosyltransferase involved in cell wall biosynthesis
LKVAALIPAFQAQNSVPDVIRAIQAEANNHGTTLPILLVDDGSTDDTAKVAQDAGAKVIRHVTNRGKGAALLTGLRALALKGFEAAVTVDADGQHPAEEALRLAYLPTPAETLVLGVRDLVRDGAPRSSQFSNSISNRFLSLFSGRSLGDTQCGLRRYPLPQVLDLATRSPGYAFEAEVILRAARAGLKIVQIPVRVWYPPASARVSHFHSVKDPTRIVFRVLGTWLERGAS